MTPAKTSPATYGALLRTRGVAPVFSLALTLIVGTSLQIFALSVYVYSATGSALWSSIAFAAGFLPQLLGGTLLTSLADRFPARTLLVSGAVVRGISAFLIAFATYLCGVYTRLSPARLALTALVVPIVAVSAAATGIAAVALQLLAVAAMLALAFAAFKPDLTTPPARVSASRFTSCIDSVSM